jgi:ABC-type sugar transport system permease subunit
MADVTVKAYIKRITWFSGRRWRHIRESAAAYAFIFPAFLVIGTFGLFPLLFSLYVSLHAWRIKPGNYSGLDNYVRALDNLAFVAGLWLVVIFGAIVVRTLLNLGRDAREHGDRPWFWAAPALVSTAGLFQFLVFAIRLLPEVLAIADKVRGQQRNQAIFLGFLGEAWRVPGVVSARTSALLILLGGVGVAYIIGRFVSPGPRGSSYYSRLILVFLLVGCAVAVGWLTLTEIQRAYVEAVEAGKELRIWPQVLAISAGIIALIAVGRLATHAGFEDRITWLLVLGGGALALGIKLALDGGQTTWIELLIIGAGMVALFFSWKAWHAAQEAESTGGFILWVFTAIAMMLGAWLLVAEVPQAIRAGYRDWWDGLLNTIYYVLFTVPAELVLGLFLAVLLFQKIKGKSFFRLIYFLPYVTNPVAAASVFRVIFSSRVTAPLNSILNLMGMSSLLWLDEPKGIFHMLFPALNLPPLLAGPSLAMFVICLYGIWSFAGYNTVIFLAGLGSIPTPLYEAAAIDGAGRWQQFRHITLPLLSPTTYFLTLIAVIGTFKAFNHLWVLRSGAALGTTDTASIIIFNEFNRNTRYGYASALALVLMGFILVLTLVNSRIAEKKVFYG